METLKLSLTTFLRISARKTRSKIRELTTFTSPGGYDFYKVMKRLAHGLASGKIDFDQALQEVAKIKQTPERKHTQEAIACFYTWLITQPEFNWVEPPKETFTSTSGLLKIKLTPELAYSTGKGKPIALQLWNLKTPDLKPALAAKGVRLLIDDLPNKFSCGIFDLRKQHIHTEAVITGASDVQLDQDIKIIEAIWTDIHDTGMTTEDVVEHVDAITAP